MNVYWHLVCDSRIRQGSAMFEWELNLISAMTYIFKYHFHLALLKPKLIQTSQIIAVCLTLILVTVIQWLVALLNKISITLTQDYICNLTNESELKIDIRISFNLLIYIICAIQTRVSTNAIGCDLTQSWHFLIHTSFLQTSALTLYKWTNNKKW
jgi:hypothetical protein